MPSRNPPPLLLLVTAGMALAGAPGPNGAAGADVAVPPLELKEGQAQLFVDDFLISQQSGLVRTLRQPRKDGGGSRPLLALEGEFGDTRGTLEANGTILHDPKLRKWVMFALAFASSYPGPSADRVRLYRFTSPDAMSWIKGDDGKPQRLAIDLHDPASNTSATNIDLFSCTHDDADSAFPYKGWLHFANWGGTREGTYFMRSADGIHWERGPQVLVAGSRSFEQGGRRMNGSGDVTTFYHDRQENRFLGNIRFAGAANVENENRLRARGFIFVERLDEPIDLARIERLALVPAAAERNGDMPFDEYYSSTAWRYESMWLGGLRIWHGAGDYSWSAAGAAYLKLVSSRDGLSWQKVPFRNEDGHPEVFIPNGKEGGGDAGNDGGYMTEFSNAPLRVGDELIYYYGASSWGKNHPRPYRVSGGGIFRARLRSDGFVSIDGGALTTRPLAFAGVDLFVNGAGPIEVEALTPAGEALGRAAVEGDSLRHRVLFGGRKLRDLAPGGCARLRFAVTPGGRLYSFTIGSLSGESTRVAEGRARPQRPAPVISPEIGAAGSVTFRCRAPQAKEVKVTGQFGPEAAMAKAEDGVWSVTVPSVPPGVHEYRFVIDGLGVIDPLNAAIKPQRWPNTSILHVPAEPPAPWDLQDIPHGVLHEHTYRSKALGGWRRLVVYTPPGAGAAGPLPVLYLAHGFSDNEGTWTVHGKAHWILDSLLAEKKAVPMLIVMPDAHALPPGPGYRDDYSRANTEAFCRELVEDVIPLVEQAYPAAAKPEARAFAGLSMGGHHALTVALNHHAAFGWIGAFSSAPPSAELIAGGLAGPDQVNSHLKLLWIGCGSKDFLFRRNNDFTALLMEKGIRHEYSVTENDDHSWPVWRRYLAAFAPRLFR